MTKVFVDTNVIIDLLADRVPHSKYAIALFEHAEEEKVRLYTTSLAFATTYYLLKKYVDDKKLRKIMYDLLAYFEIIAVDEHIIRRSLKSKIKDFEDALQIKAALSIDKMDYIVTRNLKDFKQAEIPVMSPDQILEKL